MGSAAPKPKPMRSRKSGLKKKKLIDQNILVLKKLSEEIKKKGL
jgi:hypothetical protein